VAESELSRQLRVKAGQVQRRGSPLYAELLEHAARDVDSGGPSLDVLRDCAGEPADSALALRFLSAVHRVVLEGDAPQLARHYPSAEGSAGPHGAWPAFRQVLLEHSERLRAAVALPCQTNDVGRCAALLPGFLAVAAEYGLALRILELGSSAGLNLLWDRYRYEAETWSWGPQGSPVTLSGDFSGRPDGPDHVVVLERSGCDAAPLDVADPDARLTLRSSIWADQVRRHELLDAALDMARANPPTVDRADAGDWLEAKLGDRVPGTSTVVFHSILWQYLDDRQRERLRALLQAAGAQASASAPLAWLRMEPPGELATVTLTTWPGGNDRVIARAGYHGQPVQIV